MEAIMSCHYVIQPVPLLGEASYERDCYSSTQCGRAPGQCLMLCSWCSSDPNAKGQDKFCPSSAGWPPFMRVNPVLDWEYSDVWAFLAAARVQYCQLYDQGYTSLGAIHNTLQNRCA